MQSDSTIATGDPMEDKMHETTTERPRYWFNAKCYGWGWGLPATWEGWLTLIAFIIACCCSEWLAGGSTPIAIGIILSAAVALIGVAWWKGEPPRWRWGKDT